MIFIAPWPKISSKLISHVVKGAGVIDGSGVSDTSFHRTDYVQAWDHLSTGLFSLFVA